jgi:hypothetical protein
VPGLLAYVGTPGVSLSTIATVPVTTAVFVAELPSEVLADDLGKEAFIDSVEGAGFGAVDVEHGNQFARLIADGHADLRAGVAVTGDVTRELRNVRDDLSSARPSRRTADPAVERDVQAAQRALVGPHDELPDVYEIEADPEVVGQRFPTPLLYANRDGCTSTEFTPGPAITPLDPACPMPSAVSAVSRVASAPPMMAGVTEGYARPSEFAERGADDGRARLVSARGVPLLPCTYRIPRYFTVSG